MEELTFNDKKFISAKRAAELTGYTNDYVGQLCRAGKVNAKIVGRSWYVEEVSILKHKSENQNIHTQTGFSQAVESTENIEDIKLDEIYTDMPNNDADENPVILNRQYENTAKKKDSSSIPYKERLVFDGDIASETQEQKDGEYEYDNRPLIPEIRKNHMEKRIRYAEAVKPQPKFALALIVFAIIGIGAIFSIFFLESVDQYAKDTDNNTASVFSKIKKIKIRTDIFPEL